MKIKRELIVGIKSLLFEILAQLGATVIALLFLVVGIAFGDYVLVDIISAILMLIGAIGSYFYLKGFLIIKFQKWIYKGVKK